MLDRQFLRTTILRSLGYALFVATTSFIADLFMLRIWGQFRGRWAVANVLTGTAVLVVLQARAYAHRKDMAEVNNYQAHNYLQKIKIGNALQTIAHVIDTCDHVGDPDHQKCRAAMRMELRQIGCAMGHSPNPSVIPGNKPQAIAAHAH